MEWKEEKAFHKQTGEHLSVTFEKMSKSKYNGVDPHKVVSQFGADTTRLFILFKAPPQNALEWDDSAIQGQHRWICRMWNLAHKYIQHYKQNKSSFSSQCPPKEQQRLLKCLNETVESVTKDIEEHYAFNTAVSSLMKLSNELVSFSAQQQVFPSKTFHECLLSFVLMLSPMAPHFSAEVWQMLREEGPPHPLLQSHSDILFAEWPTFDQELKKSHSVVVVVQVDGKKRALLDIPTSLIAQPQEIEKLAQSEKNVQKHLEGKKVKKVIVAESGKSINFVLEK